MTTDINLPLDDEIAAWLDAVNVESFPDPDGGDREAFVESIDAAAAEDSRRVVFGLMRAIRRERAALADIDAWLATISASVADQTRRHERTVEFLSEQVTRIAEDLMPEGKKSVDVPGLGRIQYRDTKASLRIADPEAFIKSLDADERARLVEQRPHLKTNDAKAYAAQVLETTGEVIAGVEQVPARRSASIQWAARA